jgi:hypothetical protein
MMGGRTKRGDLSKDQPALTRWEPGSIVSLSYLTNPNLPSKRYTIINHDRAGPRIASALLIPIWLWRQEALERRIRDWIELRRPWDIAVGHVRRHPRGRHDSVGCNCHDEEGGEAAIVALESVGFLAVSILKKLRGL